MELPTTALPPDSRRCVPVRVADVPLKKRLEAVREYNRAFVDDPIERLQIAALAVAPPPTLTAWVSRSWRGESRTSSAVSRATVERIFELREQGLSIPAMAEQLGRSSASVKWLAAMGREGALQHVAAREERELAKSIRAELEQRLNGWPASELRQQICRSVQGGATLP